METDLFIVFPIVFSIQSLGRAKPAAEVDVGGAHPGLLGAAWEVPHEAGNGPNGPQRLKNHVRYKVVPQVVNAFRKAYRKP